MFQPVTEANLETAAAIHAEAWRESHKWFCSPDFVAAHTTARQMGYIRREMSQGKIFYLLTLDSPKGIVSVQDNLIENLYVLPEEQRKGYGTMLLRFAEGLCIGTPRLWVLSNNHKAISLYRRCGYGLTGNRKRLNGNLEELELSHPVMKKVIVIGCPGAGKSTFARKLRDVTGLPLYYLDMLWHKPDRTNVTREEFDAALQSILKTNRWIIDGNYNRTMERRLAVCDTVFLLDYPLEVCLSGAQSRIGTQREDMPWVEEELDPEFKQWILDFSRDQAPEIHRLLDQYREGKNIFVFKNRQDADVFLRGHKINETGGIPPCSPFETKQKQTTKP